MDSQAALICLAGREIPGVRTRRARMPRGTYARNLRLCEFSNDVLGFVQHPDDVIGTEQRPELMRAIGCCQGPAGDSVHAAVDDHSRPAAAEILPDAMGATCAGLPHPRSRAVPRPRHHQR
jgi:hypothetical protein